ncbi:MAG: DUF503 domain-containing protein [Magnetococcales bacterium]|nr:DUF503 domain-containing protein [Magnetococcales bacterium]
MARQTFKQRRGGGRLMMHVGVLEIYLDLGSLRSLKEKRGIIKGLLQKIRLRFEVAAAEVAEQNSIRSSGLGFSAVGNDAAVLQSRLRKIVNFIEVDGRAVIGDFRVEIL